MLKSGIFTKAGVDYIENNQSSTIAHFSFHGTGISLFKQQKSPTDAIKRQFLIDETIETTFKLPESYTTMQHVHCSKIEAPIPHLQNENLNTCQQITQAMESDYKWLDEIEKAAMNTEEPPDDENVSWAAYSMSNQPFTELEHTITDTSLLTLFFAQAKSVAMICHSIGVIKSGVNIINSSQIPVVTVDQPLYNTVKEIQWKWPETHGKDHFVILF